MVTRDDIEGAGVVVGRLGMEMAMGKAQAGLRHSRFAEWPANLCRASIIFCPSCLSLLRKAEWTGLE